MNGYRGFKVPPRSTKDIRKIACSFREIIGDPRLSMGMLLEKLLYEGMLHVVPNDDKRFARNVEAVYIPGDKCIRLRQRDYEACVDWTSPRSIFTFSHEFGHLVLGHERSFNRDESQAHKIYEDSEWQANTFAAEFLMPLDIIDGEGLRTPEDIVRRFGVSYDAARTRLRRLKRI